MRVETVAALPDQNAIFREFTDLALERALKNFLAALGTEDSLFIANVEGARLGEGAGLPLGKICSGTITLKFRDEDLLRNREAHFSLLEKLTELLRQAGSAESLGALIRLEAKRRDASHVELSLALRLEATGSSPEQSSLRWSIGLAHVQQALLFASRSLRQQFK